MHFNFCRPRSSGALIARRMLVVSVIAALGGISSAQASELVGATRVAQTALVLVGIIALIFGLAYVARRVQNIPGRTSGTLKIVDALAVGARERVVLLEVDGERLLIAVAGGRIDPLHVVGRATAAVGEFNATLRGATTALERTP